MANNQNVTTQVGLLGSLMNRGRLVWRLLRDPRVPLYLKALPIGAVLYAVMPLDFLPDIAPLVGQIDDIGILLAGIEGFIALSPQYIVDEHMAAIQGGQSYTAPNSAPGTTSNKSETIDGEWRVK
jgi:uncharacterized membrane protein YkvA (DUF1232 family)